MIEHILASDLSPTSCAASLAFNGHNKQHSAAVVDSILNTSAITL